MIFLKSEYFLNGRLSKSPCGAVSGPLCGYCPFLTARGCCVHCFWGEKLSGSAEHPGLQPGRGARSEHRMPPSVPYTPCSLGAHAGPSCRVLHLENWALSSACFLCHRRSSVPHTSEDSPTVACTVLIPRRGAGEEGESRATGSGLPGRSCSTSPCKYVRFPPVSNHSAATDGRGTRSQRRSQYSVHFAKTKHPTTTVVFPRHLIWL